MGSKSALYGLVALLTLIAPATVLAQFDVGDMGGGMGGMADSTDRVRTEVKATRTQVPVGGDLPVAVIFDMDPRWHIWTNQRNVEGYDNFDFAVLTEINVDLPSHPGVIVRDDFLQWPKIYGAESNFGDGPQNYAVFEGRAIAYLPIVITDDAAPGPVELTFNLTFQTCDDRNCLAPADVTHTLAFDIGPAGGASPAISDADFGGFPVDVFGKIREGQTGEAAAENVGFNLFGISFNLNAASTFGLILLLIVAAVGGALLNFTPCVLPVIPIKIMGLSQSAGNRGELLALGAAMLAGVVTFWMAIGVAIAAVQGFTSINQLFQYPIFSIGVGVFILVMAVGMCGVFGLRLPQFVYQFNPGHDTLLGSFGMGVMAAVLSTPCTAPFMGVAAAWAATQTATIVLTVFAAIGLGMGLPYFVLSAFPKLIDRMPRTGPASELLKQVMGLLMVAAGAYFLGVGLSGLLATPGAPPSLLYWWAVAAAGAGAGVWLIYRTARITPSWFRRTVFGGIGALILAISGYIGVRWTDGGPIDWVYYTPERFADALEEDNIVVMEFTAEWCINCKMLEKTVLYTDRVSELLNSEGIVPIKVDLTGNNKAGNAMLQDVDRITIPLLVVFRPDGTESFKQAFYTIEQVLDAVAEAQSETVAMK